jgi:hypothetical protein
VLVFLFKKSNITSTAPFCSAIELFESHGAQETEGPAAAAASTERGEQQKEGTASNDPVIEDVQSTAPEISLEQKKDQ